MSKETLENSWAPYAVLIGAATLVINLLVAASGNRTFARAALIIVSLVAIIVGIWPYAFTRNKDKPYTKNGKFGFEPKYRYYWVANSIVFSALFSLFLVIIYTLMFIEIIPDCCGFVPTIAPTTTATPTTTPTLSATPTLTETQVSIPLETVLPPLTDVCSFSNGPLKVGVIDLGLSPQDGDIFNRLKQIGVIPTLVLPTATYKELSLFDVVYLPFGWAIKDPELERYPKFIKDYVNEGGGLLVEPPNSKFQVNPSFLPFPITYTSNKMDPEDWPLIVVDSTYILTRGLDKNELPGPMGCADMNSAYFPMVVGSKTGCTSLAITSSGSGRIMISMGNSSLPKEDIGYFSDEALCRMIGWLAKVYDQ